MRKACLNEIYKLAKNDERILFFGSDIGAGTLANFQKEMPERFFMEGVSEAAIIGVMAGLAMNGKIPYMNTVGVFLTRRVYEQVLLDAAMHKQKIRLIGSGGGLVYAPLGATHLAFDDIALMRAIPNMTVIAPCDAEEMKRLMPLTIDIEGPIYIRLAKGGDPIVSLPDKPFKVGKAIDIRSGSDVLLLTTGITLKMAIDAANVLEKQKVSCQILHLHTLKPLDDKAIIAALAGKKLAVSIEEHTIIGGLGSAVSEVVATLGAGVKLSIIGIPDVFPDKYGSQSEQLKYFGITSDKIIETVRKNVKA